ncbi:MAG: polysaccharide export protein [Caulobacteraceae bacterium]|nr:polysaccharide export protein [Caulobacteraceae bacterium]
MLAVAVLSGDPATAVAQSTLPPPDATSGVVEQDYRIGPLDELDMIVFQEKDMSQTVDVDASGRITLPLVGDVMAAGKTPQQLSQEISHKLEHYLREPQVAILVKKANSQKVIVEGQVGQPGVYPITGRTTLLQAVALAKGADQYADTKHVAVFRFVANKRYSQTFNLDAVRKGKSPDPEIFGNDIVVVQKNGFKSALRDYVTPLGIPLVYLVPKL